MKNKLERKLWIAWASLTHMFINDMLSEEFIDEIFDDLLNEIEKTKRGGKNERKRK